MNGGIERRAIARTRRRLERQIDALKRKIEAVENGDLFQTIAGQTSAPSCSICEIGPLGFPGQPSMAPAQVHAL